MSRKNEKYLIFLYFYEINARYLSLNPNFGITNETLTRLALSDILNMRKLWHKVCGTHHQLGYGGQHGDNHNTTTC